jgi:MFS family permease
MLYYVTENKAKIDMFRTLIQRIFRRRHYWRIVSFDEIAELYTSRLLTTFAINIVNLFAAVYLYKLGYSVMFITLFYGILYLFKVPFSYIAARYAAYFGPKHGIFLAALLRIPSLIAFMFAPSYGLPAIIIFGVLQQMSSALYDLCYLIDFSKIKNSLHPGKEIGTMQVIEKIARIASPLAGGVIASVYTPQMTILVACLLFMVSAWPLFRSVEPTMTKTRLRISGFPWRLSLPSLVSESVVGFDFVASGMAWTLFITLFIFEALGQGTYAALGGLASLGVFVSVITAWTFGQIVDKHKGGLLLSAGTIVNLVIHLFRPFVNSTPGIMGVNMANESATSAYSIPFTRVVFDVADASGFRITYMMFIEMTLNFGAALGCFVLAVCLHLFGTGEGMKAMFVLAGLYELLMLISSRAAK